MFGSRTTGAITFVIGAAAIATIASGVTYAASTHQGGVKACATPKHVLTLPLSHGKCAHGSHPVTIGEQGPPGAKGKPGLRGTRGPAGPSDLYSAQGAVGSDVVVLDADTNVAEVAPVPAGTYQVTANLDLANEANSTQDVICELYANDNGSLSGQIAQQRFVEAATDAGGYEQSMSLQGVATFTAAGHVILACNATQADASDWTLSALKVGTFFSQLARH